MSLLWLALPALGCVLVGYCLGYAHGRENGTQDAYGAVERWHEGRNR